MFLLSLKLCNCEILKSLHLHIFMLRLAILSAAGYIHHSFDVSFFIKIKFNYYIKLSQHYKRILPLGIQDVSLL